MLIPPKYFLTPKITQLLQSIEASKEVIDTITIPPEVESNIRRSSSLKSSLFSARIEGNDLTLDEVTNRPSKEQRQHEVYNILKALTFLQERGSRDLTQTVILDLHNKVLSGLAGSDIRGTFRSEMSAIYNAAGIAVYLAPKPNSIPSLMKRLLIFTNSEKELFVPIRAALTHYIFEKIHPFLDGNGRVGRLILQAILLKGGYSMKGLLSLEEYLDQHRTLYYDTLMNSEHDVTDFVEFILSAIADTAKEAKELVLEKQHTEITDYLLPRRAEIYQLIKDHELLAFDQIQRRFMRVNGRTLRYDIKKLVDAGLIKKLGTTKGVYYQINKKSLPF